MMQFFRKNVRSIMLVVVVLFVASCFAGYGMYSGRSQSGETPQEGQADYLVAIVAGEKIMRSRMDYEMFQMIQAMGLAQTVSDDDLPAIRSNILDQMAVIAELDKEVNARGIAASKEEIDETIKDIEGTFPTREIFMQELQRANMDEKKLRDEVETQIKRQKVFEQVISPASVDANEVQALYDTMKAYAFQKPEGFDVNLAHFKTEESADSARKDLEAGREWDDVMEAASDDVINFTPYENTVMVPTSGMQGEVEFLKDAPMNEVTKPVMLASEDYMIVVKREKHEASTATFDEVSADITTMLVNQERQKLQSEFLQELRNRAVVEIFDHDIFAKNEPAPAEPIVDLSPDIPGGEENSADADTSEGANSEDVDTSAKSEDQ